MEKQQLIAEVEKNIKNCQKCRLYKTATHPVPGEGNINSKIVFIGEAPGYYEDASGRPFVGRAGKLLESLLSEIGYKREDVWIGNIIKHRPPENRDPLPDEISSCFPYLDLQLKAIDPVLIITLGRYSMNHFYEQGKISRDHGHLVKAGNKLVYPLYHPAAALRSSTVKADLRSDFLKIPEVLKKAEEYLQKGTNDSQSLENSDDGQLGLGL